MRPGCENLGSYGFELNAQVFERHRGHTAAFNQQTEQNMLGADQRMFERGRLGARELERLPHARGKREQGGRGVRGQRGNQALDFPAHCVALDLAAFEDLSQRTP